MAYHCVRGGGTQLPTTPAACTPAPRAAALLRPHHAPTHSALAAPAPSTSNSHGAHRRRAVTVRSIPVSGPPGREPSSMASAPAGQISSTLIADMTAKIGEALATDKVKIADAYGDGRHVSIDVVSPLFEGESAVKRQRMVYKAIWLELQDAVHAVDEMKTRTPEEAGLS